MGKYDDIINMEHPTSARHPRMSAIDRAAQFSAFAALTGYEDIICETGRQTDSRPELDEEELRRLDETLNIIQSSLSSRPFVKGLRFVPDRYKKGGHKEAFEGHVKNIDLEAFALILSGDIPIPLQDICELSVSTL